VLTEMLALLGCGPGEGAKGLEVLKSRLRDSRPGSSVIDQSPQTLVRTSNTHCGTCHSLSKFHIHQAKKMLDFSLKMRIYVQNSITSAFSLGHLVNDLLDHAKMETSTFGLNYEHFNLYETVTEAFEIS